MFSPGRGGDTGASPMKLLPSLSYLSLVSYIPYIPSHTHTHTHRHRDIHTCEHVTRWIVQAQYPYVDKTTDAKDTQNKNRHKTGTHQFYLFSIFFRKQGQNKCTACFLPPLDWAQNKLKWWGFFTIIFLSFFGLSIYFLPSWYTVNLGIAWMGVWWGRPQKKLH